jgi:polar amino acid transport system substrate-binding protein
MYQLRWIRASAVFLMLSIAVTSAAFGATDLRDVKQRGELVMLCFPHSASQFISVRDGEYWGLDYEILRTFATVLDVKLVVRPVPEFAGLIPWLLEGKGDVVGSSFSITEERKKKVDFTEDYFPVRIMIVAKKGVTLGDASNLDSRRVAVVPGSSLEAFIRQRFASVKFVPVSETLRAYETVESGMADFAPVDSTAALTDLTDFPDLEAVFTFPDKMGYGFAVRKGSDLAPILSEHVQRLRSTGVFYQQLGRFLGPRAIEMVKAAEAKR